MSEFDTILNQHRTQVQDPLTQEQEEIRKARAEALKEKREQCYAMIDEACLAITSSAEKLQVFLEVQSRFERYLLNNILLIYKQSPNATRLKDFSGWKKDGKNVKKGSKSLVLLEPHPYTTPDQSAHVGYHTKAMFDISDVAPAEPIAQVARDPKLLIRALVHRCPAEIQTRQDYPTDRQEGAYYDPQSNRICVRAGMQADEIFLSVAQAMAHAEMASKNRKDYRTSDHAFQARCAAYSLAQKYGIPVDSVKPFGIPPKYQGSTAEEIKPLLAEIHGSVLEIANRMSEVLDRPRAQKQKQVSKQERDAR